MKFRALAPHLSIALALAVAPLACTDDVVEGNDEVGDTAGTDTAGTDTGEESESGSSSSDTTDETTEESTEDTTESTEESTEDTTDTETDTTDAETDTTGGEDGITCQELGDCIDACDDDPSCEAECADMASVEGLDEYLTLVDCYEDNMVDEAIEIAEFCAEELAACAAETAGDGTCPEILNCQGACDGDEACEDECFNQGTMDAQVAFVGLIYCWVDTCPNFNQMCLATSIMPGGACAEYGDACGLNDMP